jgi:hypothetical protein
VARAPFNSLEAAAITRSSVHKREGQILTVLSCLIKAMRLPKLRSATVNCRIGKNRNSPSTNPLWDFSEDGQQVNKVQVLIHKLCLWLGTLTRAELRTLNRFRVSAVTPPIESLQTQQTEVRIT